MPRKTSSQEVHDNVADAFEIITTTLLNAEMSGDRGVTSSAGKTFVAAVRDVLPSFRVAEMLGEAEVDDVDCGRALAEAEKEVVRLDVPVYE